MPTSDKRNPAGSSVALSSGGIAAAASALSVHPAEVWTVLSVETGGCGFLPDRRPRILFERHIFSRLTHGRFDICDVSNPVPGGYGAGGAHQHDRLAQALALDRSAALQSASWGLAQILGMNWSSAGFPDIETMAARMSDSEDAQLAAFVAFLKAKGLGRQLQGHDWSAFALGYNGADFAENAYDTRLAAAFQRFSSGNLPDLGVRAAQLYLTFAGKNPGGVDGAMGPNTRRALLAYQQEQGLPRTGLADDATLARLVKVAPG